MGDGDGGDRPMGETAPNAVLSGRLIEKLSLAIKRLVSYLRYRYGVLKRNWVFLKFVN